MIIVVLALALALCAGAVWADPLPSFGHDNTNFATASGAYSASNYVYDWGTYTWEVGTETPIGGDGFTVTADIEMWMSMAFSATDIYFHIGQDTGGASMDADVPGWLSSNNGQYLFVTKKNSQPTEDNITQLAFKNDIGHRSGQTANPIPIEWWISDNSGWHQMTYSTGGNNSQVYGVQWLLDGGSTGTHNFTIKCRIKPDRFQPDGYYEMDPVLVASPAV